MRWCDRRDPGPDFRRPAIRRFHPRHWITGVLLLMVLGGFAFALVDGAYHWPSLAPSFQQLEESGRMSGRANPFRRVG